MALRFPIYADELKTNRHDASALQVAGNALLLTGRPQVAGVEVKHNQHIVLASINGAPLRQVGYIGTQSGAPLNGTHDLRVLPESVQEQIRQEVSKKLGHDAKMFVPAPPHDLLVGGENDEE